VQKGKQAKVVLEERKREEMFLEMDNTFDRNMKEGAKERINENSGQDAA
jgi:hypothetical protein